MTLETFAEEMKIRVQEKAGNHYEVDLERSLGNNGTEVIRLAVKKESDSGTAPAALLNGFYNQISEKESEDFLEEMAEEIVRLFCFSYFVENYGETRAEQIMYYDL